MMDRRLQKLAELLVNYSAKVQPGEFVLIQADAVALDWIKAVANEVTKAGAHFETIVHIGDVSDVFVRHASDEQLQHEREIQKFAIGRADVWLTAWANTNTRSNSNVDPQRLRLMSEGARSWREIYLARMGEGKLRWCGTQFPTHSDAQEAEMSFSEYEDFVYGAGMLDTDNPVQHWRTIDAEQKRLCAILDTKSEIRFLSKDTDITAGIRGQKWVSCVGEVNFPDGEIFTAPLKNSVNGHIRFSFPGIYLGKAIENIFLRVENGKVVEATADKGEDLLKTQLNLDAGACYFGEIAVGTNFGIQKFTRNMLFDEKIGGTIHFALGNGYAECGEVNKSALHWDMLCDMRSGGSIYADGALIYKDGKFLI